MFKQSLCISPDRLPPTAFPPVTGTQGAGMVARDAGNGAPMWLTRWNPN